VPHRITQQLGAFGPMWCVLIFDTATAATYVPIVTGELTVYSQRAIDPDDAAAAAEELWSTLAENRPSIRTAVQ
jgi:hypothetical protein